MAGQAGRPIGAENKHKRFKAALFRYAEAHPKKLEALVEKMWEVALDGDISAIREIADRMDGKPVQAVEVGEPGSFEEKSVTELFADIQKDLAELGVPLGETAH